MSEQPVQTASVMLQTLCVPCACRCRYCLLSWDGKCLGAAYDRSQAYAARFAQWMRRNRPEVEFNFSFGYSMEHPRLPETLAFLRSIGSVGGEYLQMDGMRMRDEKQAAALMAQLAACGVRQLNFTFYGTEAYHDAFAGRRGDHALLLRMLRAALNEGLQVSAGMPLNHENAAQADAMLNQLTDAGVERVVALIPHAEGRGAQMEGVRFTQADFDALPLRVQARINRQVFRPEAQWLRDGFGTQNRRMLLISLTPENIERFESMEVGDVLAEVEALDEAYYAAFPAPEALADRFGDPRGDRWFSGRDLMYRYRRLYMRECGLRLYDVTDERGCGSRRY